MRVVRRHCRTRCPGNVLDVPNYSWREYGQRAGIWRLFDTFDEVGVPSSCTLNAKLGLERRDIVEAAKERGWELVCHNYEQGDLLTNYQSDPAAEEALIDSALSVYEDVVGRKSPGWLSSSLRSTPNTPEILAKKGMKFICDYMNDEQPYLMKTAHGAIVAIPYSIEVNDFGFFLRRNFTTTQTLEMLKEQFDQLYLESAKTGKLMSVGLHPHVSGIRSASGRSVNSWPMPRVLMMCGGPPVKRLPIGILKITSLTFRHRADQKC